MNLKPLGDRLIVKAIEEEETTASGIVLPDTAKEKPQKGTVVAVGDGAWDEDGEKRIPLDVAAGHARLAEAAVQTLAAATVAEFRGTHGDVPDGELVVLALGRLGGGALTHASDLDLVYLFTGGHLADSDGRRPLGATHYFNRLAARVSAALSAPTAASAADPASHEVGVRVHRSDPCRIGRRLEQRSVAPGRVIAAIERCSPAPSSAARDDAVDLDDEADLRPAEVEVDAAVPGAANRLSVRRRQAELPTQRSEVQLAKALCPVAHIADDDLEKGAPTDTNHLLPG